jgi:hypothetical protein
MLYPRPGSTQRCLANLGMPLVTLHKHGEWRVRVSRLHLPACFILLCTGTHVSSSKLAARATAANSAAGAAMRALAGVDVALDTAVCLRDGAAWVSTSIAQGWTASHVLEVLQNALLVLQRLLTAALAELETGWCTPLMRVPGILVQAAVMYAVPFLFSDNATSTSAFRCWEGVTAAALTAALTADAAARAAELGLAALQAFGQAGLSLYRGSLVWPAPAELAPVVHAEAGASAAAWDWDAPDVGSPVTQAPLQPDDSVLHRIASFLG